MESFLTGLLPKLICFTLSGVTAFSDTAARAAAGDFLRVPVLAGSLANEGDIFITVGEILEIDALIQPVLDILSSIFTLVSVPYGQYGRILNHLLKGTTCATAKTTDSRAAAGVSIFRYQYQGRCSGFRCIKHIHINDFA